MEVLNAVLLQVRYLLKIELLTKRNWGG